MAKRKAVQEQAVLHGFCINRSGSRPPAAQRGRVRLLLCGQTFGFSALSAAVPWDRAQGAGWALAAPSTGGLRGLLQLPQPRGLH